MITYFIATVLVYYHDGLLASNSNW